MSVMSGFVLVVASSWVHPAFAQIDHYEPFVAVDIADLADDESALYDTEYGETMDVNDELFACGWYVDSGDDDQPFFLDPRDGGSAYKLEMSTYDEGRALALSGSTDYDMSDIVVVGWVKDGSDQYAAYWTNNGTTWSVNLVPSLGSADYSLATDVDPTGNKMVGYYEVSSVKHPFTYNGSSTNLITSFEADALGIDSAGAVVTGTRFDTVSPPPPVAYHAVLGSTVTELTVTDYEESHGIAVNVDDDVVGYAVDTDTNPDTLHGILWYFDNSSWTAHVMSTDEPDPVDSALTDVTDQSGVVVDIVGTYFDSSAGPAEPNGAFYVTMDASTGAYSSYSLDEVTSGQDAHPSLAFFPLRIRREVEANSWAPETYTANGINNIASIAGSYFDGKPSTPSIRPCLYVANDVNNNGEPDIREILHGDEADDNENWLIDWAENDQSNTNTYMRVGLHAPGYDGTSSGTYTQHIANVNVVRLGMSLTRFTGMASELPELVALDEAIDPEENVCENLTIDINNWAQNTVGDEQREIILFVRSVHDDVSGRDSLPPDNETRESHVVNIRAFAYRYAHCIDYMQFGNEVYGGAGRYGFREEDLSGCGIGWNGSGIENVPAACFPEAVEAILDWLGEQSEAARIGSALAGRPVRFFGPGVQDGHLSIGDEGDADGSYTLPANEDNRAAYIVRRTAQYVNFNRMIWDQHLYYLTYDDDTETPDVFTEHIDRLTASGSYTNVDWKDDVPMLLGILELGPHPADFPPEQEPVDLDNWMDAFENQIDDYVVGGQELDPATWNAFQEDWELNETIGQFRTDGFQLDDVFDDLNATNFVVVCYAATQQPGTSNGPEWHLNALRAQHIHADYFLTGNKSEKFTHLRDTYEDAAGDHLLEVAADGFEPHPSACDCADVCDDCEN